MGVPQIILIVLYSINLGLAWAEHGKPKTGKNNAWATLLGTTIVVILLYDGEFFK